MNRLINFFKIEIYYSMRIVHYLPLLSTYWWIENKSGKTSTKWAGITFYIGRKYYLMRFSINNKLDMNLVFGGERWTENGGVRNKFQL